MVVEPCFGEVDMKKLITLMMLILAIYIIGITPMLITNLMDGALESKHPAPVKGDYSIQDALCIDGIEHFKVQYFYEGHIIPHYHPDGTLYTCE